MPVVLATRKAEAGGSQAQEFEAAVSYDCTIVTSLGDRARPCFLENKKQVKSRGEHIIQQNQELRPGSQTDLVQSQIGSHSSRLFYFFGPVSSSGK